MVATMTNISTEITGRVEKVGSYGFTLEGRSGWVSLSKFAEPRPELPQPGEQVRVALDKAGYARAIDVVTPATYRSGFHAVSDAEQGAPRSEEAATGAPSKDTMIARMNSITNAVAILSSGGMVAEIGAVLEYAATLESWVLR